MVKFKRLSRKERKEKNSKVQFSYILDAETILCQRKKLPAAALSVSRLC